MTVSRVPDRADVCEKFIRKLHGRMMPPQGMPRPDEATLDAFAASLETTIDRASLARPNPGRSPLHRLNRSEYAAAIHDLLGLDVDVNAYLPPDTMSGGFDNIADVQNFSPQLMEVAHPAGQDPVRPFTGDPLTPRLTGQAWAEDELVFFIDFGIDRFRVNPANFVVTEVAMFRLSLMGADGTPQPLPVPPIVGTGPLGTPRAADAPGGFPRFGALRHEYLTNITPRAGDPPFRHRFADPQHFRPSGSQRSRTSRKLIPIVTTRTDHRNRCV